MIYVVIIGGLLSAVSLILAAVEYVTGREIEEVHNQRVIKEIARHRPEPWSIHDRVTIVPKEDT